MKNKLSLNTIKVKSFVTALDQNTSNKIIGGNYTGEAKTCDGNDSQDQHCTKKGECVPQFTGLQCTLETEDRACLGETVYTCPVESNGAFCEV